MKAAALVVQNVTFSCESVMLSRSTFVPAEFRASVPLAMCDDPLLLQTRRHFFHNCAVGVGSLALATLLKDNRLPAAETPPVLSPLMPRPSHFKARATSIIYLFMAGGPSQLELFDFKPKLVELDGQPIPDSYLHGKRFAFMDSFTKEVPRLLAARRQFARHGQCGAWVSECLPHLA